MDSAARFRYFKDKLQSIAGGKKLSFSQETYLGEVKSEEEGGVRVFVSVYVVVVVVVVGGGG
jgi:hypothetical protein